MNRLRKIAAVITVFACVFALTWFVYFPRSPLGRQLANLKLAEKHRPVVEERLRTIPGANAVKCGAYTGFGGSLSIWGDVADDQTADAVMSGVLATIPPVTIDFSITVGGTNLVRKTVQLGATESNHLARPPEK
jgi:hypothetical protein